MIVLTFVLIIICMIGFYLWRKQMQDEFWKHINAIPEPYTSSIFGALDVDMFMADTEQMFEINRKRALQHYPIFKVRSFGHVMVFLLSPDDIELVLKNIKHITKGKIYDVLRYWLGTGLLTSTGSKWQHRRKIITPSFHFGILKNFLEVFNRETESLIENLKEISCDPYINIKKPITDFTLNSIIETSLGIQIHKQPNCKKYKSSIYDVGEIFTYQFSKPWLRIIPISILFAIYQSVSETLKTLHDFSSNLIKQRKEDLENSKVCYTTKKGIALLDLLLQARFEGSTDIDDEGIREEIDTFLFEGHDTTSVAICYTLLVLANKPSVQNEILLEINNVLGNNKLPDCKALGELKYMERCIKEVLRLFPSVPIIARTLGDDLTLTSGYTLPKGTDVAILIYYMHHSPQVWDNPEHFDPDRFLPEHVVGRHPFAYLPFSAGHRNCIGQKFAIMEIKTVLCGILRHFELKPVDKIEDIKHKTDLVLRCVQDIKIQLVPRQ